jgi:SNF2 family DNA or RNA helicase
VFSAHLRAVTWRSATAADRELFQAPFRAGIRLDPYQLLPLSKALKLPRVNLLIADDVGLGKTIEAGLVLREMLLRRRVDYVVVSAPAAMTAQWQDELAQKFGLSFTIVDREYLAAVRRSAGFAANPWEVGSRFIISHSLLADETYTQGLLERLGDMRPRSMLILDEAHNAAPASGQAYAVDSNLTKSVRGLAGRFEHRLFLTATPHNGHSNSFSSLLEILDPQRFTRGVPVRPEDLEPVMVRRLKSDLRELEISKFPKRIIDPISLKGLPPATPELQLSELLDDYRSWCEANLAGEARGRARFLMSGLQQRLLSSIPAFARTLRSHLKTLQRWRDGQAATQATARAAAAAAALIAEAPRPSEEETEEIEEKDLLAGLEAEEEALADTATAGVASGLASLDEAIARVQRMLDIAKGAERKPDARVVWLVDWIKANMMTGGGKWNDRRLLIFTEWEDTRIWLEKRLKEAFEDTDRGEERIATFTGLTGREKRDKVKAAFNADPQKEPLRILLCTDAAREGLNLQTRCHDLIHFDLPWNPSRLEQRNGRIDRKLQPSPVVTCRYFVYEQRAEDLVLQALVRKTEVIREQLGSAGEVLGERIRQRLEGSGIAKGSVDDMVRAIDEEKGDVSAERARREMADDQKKRRARLQRDVAQLEKDQKRAEEHVGVEPVDLCAVVETALGRDGVVLAPAVIAGVHGAFTIDPSHPAFEKDPSWADLFDELREGRPPKRRKLAEWRANTPVRAIAFEAPVLPDGRDADGVVHLHLEHRLVRRLISRFVLHGFKAGLNRVSVIEGAGRQPRVVLIGRLALYGPSAARLHEEIIPVTALWSEKGPRVLKESGEETTLEQLEAALKEAKAPDGATIGRLLKGVQRDLAALRPVLEERAEVAARKAAQDLAEIAKQEAASLKKVITAQRDRIRREAAGKDSDQLELDLTDAKERRQRELDRRHWPERLAALEIRLGSPWLSVHPIGLPAACRFV